MSVSDLASVPLNEGYEQPLTAGAASSSSTHTGGTSASVNKSKQECDHVYEDVVVVAQPGTAGEAVVAQSGTAGEAVVAQPGTPDEAGVAQPGTADEAGVAQPGTPDEAGVAQPGTPDEAGVAQPSTAKEPLLGQTSTAGGVQISALVIGTSHFAS